MIYFIHFRIVKKLKSENKSHESKILFYFILSMIIENFVKKVYFILHFRIVKKLKLFFVPGVRIGVGL